MENPEQENTQSKKKKAILLSAVSVLGAVASFIIMPNLLDAASSNLKKEEVIAQEEYAKDMQSALADKYPEYEFTQNIAQNLACLNLNQSPTELKCYSGPTEELEYFGSENVKRTNSNESVIVSFTSGPDGFTLSEFNPT